MGARHLIYGRNAAVHSDDECGAVLAGILNAFDRNAVALAVSVGNVVVEMRVQFFQKAVHQRNGAGAVHVVVAVEQDFFTFFNGLPEPLYRRIHILHKKRIVQVFERRPEKSLGLLEAVNAPLYQQATQHRVNAQRLPERFCGVFIGTQQFPFGAHGGGDIRDVFSEGVT